MKTCRVMGIAIVAAAGPLWVVQAANAQCCLTDLFAGCGSCFRRAPVYAVAPVAAPVMAPVPAPPPPVMVPVQQVSYVPETTYRTQYQNVPVTTYKPSCEIDPCTGCPRECMQPVTQYVQQAVNVPVTQYRAVTTTKYVQMQPGYNAGAYPAAPPAAATYGAPAQVIPPAAAAPSPFATPVQPPAAAGWGAASSNVPSQPGMPPPALPTAPVGPQPTFQQQITPQAGTTYYGSAAASVSQPQPTSPPLLSPAPAPATTPAATPALKPIPELPKTGSTTSPGSGSPIGSGTSAAGDGRALQAPSTPPPAAPGIPTLPGAGPNGATRAFPRLLEPTGHTTSWQPSAASPAPAPRAAYPTAALPERSRR